MAIRQSKNALALTAAFAAVTAIFFGQRHFSRSTSSHPMRGASMSEALRQSSHSIELSKTDNRRMVVHSASAKDVMKVSHPKSDAPLMKVTFSDKNVSLMDVKTTDAKTTGQ